MTTPETMAVEHDPTVCVIIGLGGHAHVLIDSLRASDPEVSIVAIDRDTALHGKTVRGVEVIGGDNKLEELGRSKSPYSIGVGSTSDVGRRKELFRLAMELGLVPMTISHPSAIVAQSVQPAAGCQLMPGAIVNAGSIAG